MFHVRILRLCLGVSILWLACFQSALAASTPCAAELTYRRTLWEIRREEPNVSPIVLLAAEKDYRVVEYRCAVSEDADRIRDQVVGLFAQIKGLLQAELASRANLPDAERLNLQTIDDLAYLEIEVLDFRWLSGLETTLAFCEQKFTALKSRLEVVRGRYERRETPLSKLLNAKLEIEQLRDFCNLEGTIVLPPLEL